MNFQDTASAHVYVDKVGRSVGMTAGKHSPFGKVVALLYIILLICD